MSVWIPFYCLYENHFLSDRYFIKSPLLSGFLQRYCSKWSQVALTSKMNSDLLSELTWMNKDDLRKLAAADSENFLHLFCLQHLSFSKKDRAQMSKYHSRLWQTFLWGRWCARGLDSHFFFLLGITNFFDAIPC